MGATIAEKLPKGPDWIFEIKWDGVRALSYITNAEITIYTRNNNRCDRQYPELHVIPHYIDAEQAIIDGEIVVLDAKGVSKFELIQSAPVDSLPQVLDDTSLREYQTKLSELRRQRAELSVSLTPENPKVQKINAQLAEVESALTKERADIVIRIKNEYDSAVHRESLVANEYNKQLKLVDGQASKSVHYDILKREADTNHQIYESMLQKVKEAGIVAALRSSNCLKP